MTTNHDIIFEEISGNGGSVGLITLNRPKSLNALTHAMCLALDSKLAYWQDSKHIKAVIIRGAGEKAFCAGGDIRHIYQKGKEHGIEEARQFFHDEYRMNHRIHNFTKPYIALLDGITMGGGVGVSIHGSHRVATERFLFAMPETAIGFFPDVGGSYFLSRLAGELGIYLGLTGTRLNASDAMFAGLINEFTSSVHVHEIIDAIAGTNFSEEAKERVTHILHEFSVKTELSELATHSHQIDEFFSADTVEAIITRLEQDNKPWSQKALSQLKTKSPTSMKITLRQIREGVALNFDSCMQMEYRLCQRILAAHDFYEGVRAVLLDKDNTPIWQPATLAEVDEATIDSYFQPLEEGELLFN